MAEAKIKSMTHRCAARRCAQHVHEILVLCRHHETLAGFNLHDALKAAQARDSDDIFKKRMAEAQAKIDESEARVVSV